MTLPLDKLWQCEGKYIIFNLALEYLSTIIKTALNNDNIVKDKENDTSERIMHSMALCVLYGAFVYETYKRGR